VSGGKEMGHGLEAIVARLGKRTGAVRLTGLRGASRALLGAELVRSQGERPTLFLTATSKRADALRDDLRTVLGEREGEERTRTFPRHDTLPYDHFSPQPYVVAQRMAVLYQWLAAGAAASPTLGREPAPIVVAPWSALALRVPSRDSIRGHTAHLEVGQPIDRDALIERLVAAGYNRMALVEERGELAVRGGILDLFPPQRPHPVRVELLGDEVESIRDFDPASQRSQKKLMSVALPPPRELLCDRSAVIARSDEIRSLAEEQGADASAVSELLDALLRGHHPPGVEALAPILQPGLETVFDFLPPDTLVVLDEPDPGRERLVKYCEEAVHHYESSLDAARPVAHHDALLLSPDQIVRALDERMPVKLERLDVTDDEPNTTRIPLHVVGHDELRRELAASRTHERALNPLVDRLALWVSERWRVVITCAALSGAERLRDLLNQYDFETYSATDTRPIWRWSRPGRVEVRVASLSEGFALEAERLVVVTEEEIFGPREKRHRKTHWEGTDPVEGIAQLSPGDYLVHSEHGIGTYRGLIELKAGYSVAEMLCVEYLGNDRLFLPVHRLNLVQRYGGADGATPRIDRLGGQSWEKAKGKVKKSLRNMASELLAVHAAREVAQGHSFPPRDAFFEEFEAGFAFEETPDQLAAIEETLGDMQRSKPMDRLVCGDVGYGKTEVAIRAAFRAALDGKQVAVLVPTTILCQQHEETFRARFEGYPISVESLSRFRSPSESREVIEGLATGKVDVVVGTHRLLQKNVRFKDLGLLVVDEEHRFGVAHKERVKQMKKTVDVLTLTATPIPRTLQMAFTGVRDLSVINTPPADRFAIRTQTVRHSESLIREAILREVRRGGQVFFVHDRVRSIGEVAEMLARVVPEVKVIVAHGQMRERDLEDRMLAFMNGDADLLLSTTIIESGLDIPRANTIIINRAHALGLAQLYQLRGRVGRSTHRAYAYLVVPPEDALSHTAQRRLEAIQDLTELGSGFRLANMDLEIRGAGDLLGSEQSGNLLAVGYETYMEMLHETIEELRGKIKETEVDPEIRLPVTARLPDSYVADVSQRLVLYKRLASATEEADVEQIRDEILDRYGPLVPEAENLLEVIGLKILARRLGVSAVDFERGEVVLSVAKGTRIDPQRLVDLLSHPSAAMRVTPDHKIYAPAPPLAAGAAGLFDAARGLLKRLSA
jgi:transcription-repair coupling factor (superfamily II helicase)